MTMRIRGYNIQKLFVRKSLRTTNVREAVTLSRKYDEIIMGNVDLQIMQTHFV